MNARIIARAEPPDAMPPGTATAAVWVASAVLFVIAAIAIAIGNHFAVNGYMTDDAFITFRYARNFADGLGPVWQPGSRVEGYTDFGWMALLAAAMRLGAGPIHAARALGWAASAATIALVPIGAAQIRPAGSRGWWLLSFGAAAALLVNTSYLLWAFAGLETPLFTLLLFSAIVAHWHEERTNVAVPIWSAALLAGAAVTRPDGAVWFIVIAAWKLASTFSRPRLSKQGFMFWSACFVVPFVVYWCGRWAYYGDFFPNTYYLKSGSSSAFYQRGARYARDFAVVYWMWLVLFIVPSLAQERHMRFKPVSCAVCVLVAWSGYVVAAGGDWMPFFRFFEPVLPLAYLLIADGMIRVGDFVQGRSRPAVGPALSLALLAVLIFSSIRPVSSARAESPSGFPTDPLPGAVDLDVQAEIGHWLHEHVPPDYTIAEIEAGIVPYYSQRPTLDMLGVNDHHIAHLDVSVGWGPPGHEKQDGGYVLMSKPEVIWLAASLEPEARRTPADYAPPADTRGAAVVTAVTQNAYLWVFYTPLAVRLHGGWLNLLVRTDAIGPLRVESAAP